MKLTFQYLSFGEQRKKQMRENPMKLFFFHQYCSNPAWMAHSHLKLNKSQTEVLLSCLPILQNPTSPGFWPHWGPYQPPGSYCKLKDMLFMEGCAGNALPNFSSPIFLFLVDHHIFLIHFVFFQDIVELIIFDLFGGLYSQSTAPFKGDGKATLIGFWYSWNSSVTYLHGISCDIFICVHGWAHSFILILPNPIFLMTGVMLVWGIFCLILRLDPYL